MTARTAPAILRVVAPLVAAVALAACADSGDRVRLVQAGQPIEPVSRGELRIESDQPLVLGAVLSLDSSTLLVTDRVTSDVWLVDTTSREARMELLLPGDQRRRARLIAIRAAADTFELLDRSGTLHRFDRHTRSELGTARLDVGTGTIVTAASNEQGEFAVIVRRLGRQDGAVMEHALLLQGGDGEVRETWSGAAMGSTPAMAPDMLALAPSGDGWVMTGTEPARLMRFDATGTFQQETPLEATPMRKLSRELVASIRSSAEAAGLAGRVQPPRFFPPITAMRPVGTAWLAVPYTGGPTGEAQGLDVYCGSRYSHTLLDSPAIQQVLLADHGVLTVTEAGQAHWTVEYYPMTSLPLDCEPRS